jgi:hypothetical protein
LTSPALHEKVHRSLRWSDYNSVFCELPRLKLCVELHITNLYRVLSTLMFVTSASFIVHVAMSPCCSEGKQSWEAIVIVKSLPTFSVRFNPTSIVLFERKHQHINTSLPSSHEINQYLYFATAVGVQLVLCNYHSLPIPVVARSKAWVCGRSLARILGSNPTRRYGCLCFVSVACCQVKISASG